MKLNIFYSTYSSPDLNYYKFDMVINTEINLSKEH